MRKNALALVLLVACSGPPPRDELQGTVELHERVLSFELPGRLLRLEVRRGQRVEAGQVLAVLDDALERPQREARAADVAAAEAQLSLLRAGSREEDVRAAEAQVRAARAAESQLSQTARRLRTLRADGSVPQQQLDDAEGALARATAERQAAEQRAAAVERGSRSQERAAAGARVDAARAALALADKRLERLTLRAPVAGVVLDTHVEPGEVLGATMPVVTMGEPRRPYVDFFVPEGSVGGIKPGSHATVRIDTGASVQGLVEDVGRRTEFTPRFLYSPRERPNLVVRVRVALDDPNEALRAGLPAFGRIDRE